MQQQQQQAVNIDVEPYLKKLSNARRRIVLVNNVLQNAQVDTALASRLDALIYERSGRHIGGFKGRALGMIAPRTDQIKDLGSRHSIRRETVI